MKRMLQALAILQIVLIVALVFRTVSVWTTPLPEFGEIASLPAPAPLPPPKPPTRVSQSVTDSVVEHDLFDEQRGQNKDESLDGITVDAAPVPPPSTVKLMGVMLLGADPVAILLDTNVKPEQQAVKKGDMFGEYEIGEITAHGLMLLGNAGQQFQIPLKVEAAVAAAMSVPPPRTPPNATAAGGSAARAPTTRPAAARPAAQAGKSDVNAGDADNKAMSARERAQAIAARNAELRKTSQKGGAVAGQGGADNDQKGPDPVQARLEALRQLREAAKTR